jgi:hypothetical protein
MVTAFALAAIVIAWLVLAKGPVSIKWFATIVAPGLFIIQIVMLVLIFSEQSWSELVGDRADRSVREPAAQLHDRRRVQPRRRLLVVAGDGQPGTRDQAPSAPPTGPT